MFMNYVWMNMFCQFIVKVKKQKTMKQLFTLVLMLVAFNTFAQKDSLHSGSHLKLWSVEMGKGIALGYRNESNYTYEPKLAFALSRQWGYQISHDASAYIGGEYRMYNWNGVCDTGKPNRYSYTMSYLGVNTAFHILNIQSKFNWFASINVGGGIRYYDDNNKYISTQNKPAKLNVVAHSTLNVGGSVRFGKTVTEIGPYVDFIGYGMGGSILTYGLKLTIFH